MANSEHDKITKLGWGFGGCNMNCRHCYNASGKKFPVHDLGKLKAMADKIGSQGIGDINFGTGEFLVNPNALATAKYIKAKYPAIKLGLTTNGYSVRYMKNSDLKYLFHDIDISIDFPDKKKHNCFRRHPLAWDWAIAALQKCQKLGIEHSIVTCVTAQTTEWDVLGLLELARRHSAGFRINWFRPTGRGEKKLCVTGHKFWRIIYLLSRHAIFEGLSDPLLKAVIRGDKRFKPCGCGWSSARIQQDLSLTPCVFLKGKDWNAGQITEHTLDEIRSHKLFKKVRERRADECDGCKYFNTCRGGCYSRAYLYKGDERKRDPFCPFTDKRNTRLVEKIKKNITIANTEKVHNDYLCTLILKPKEVKSCKDHYRSWILTSRTAVISAVAIAVFRRAKDRCRNSAWEKSAKY